MEEDILAYAMAGKLKDIIRLLGEGYDPNYQNDDGWTALMWASKRGHIDVVTTLLEFDADPDIINNDNKTALWYSVCEGHYKISELLLEDGAYINLVRSGSDHPLCAAIDNFRVDEIILLLRNGANYCLRNKNRKLLFEEICLLAVTLKLKYNDDKLFVYLKDEY